LTLAAFLEHFPDARRVGQEYLDRCPGHDDHRPSLAIRQRGPRILIHCRSGRRPEDILRQRGLTLAALFIDARPRALIPAHLDPMATARRNILRDALRQRWAADGVMDAYAVADGIRGLWRDGRIDEARAFEAEVDAIIARETWVKGLEAVAALLAKARAQGWPGFRSGGDRGWLRRHGIAA
jgi:hypothetical protein